MNQKIHKNNQFIYAKPGLFVDSIIKDLKDKKDPLFEHEKKQIIFLVDSIEFRKFGETNIMKYVNNKDNDIRNYPKKFKFIKNALSSHCSKILDYKKLLNENKFNNQEEMKNYLLKNLKHSNSIPGILSYTFELKDDLLIKLSRLSYVKHAEFEGWFDMSVYFSQNNNP